MKPLGYSIRSWLSRIGLEDYIDDVAVMSSNLVYKDGKNIWRSKYKTSEKSCVLFKSIIYKKHLTLYEKAYYVYLASIIPVYSDIPWIPEEFVEKDKIRNLKNLGYIEPYLKGYILPKEKEEYL